MTLDPLASPNTHTRSEHARPTSTSSHPMKSTTIPLTDRMRATQDLLVLMELETLKLAKRHNLNSYWEQHQQRRQQFLQLSPRLLPVESRMNSFCEDEDDGQQQQQQQHHYHELMTFDPHEEDLLLRHHFLTNQTLCDDLTAIFHPNHQGLQQYW
ncbi:hypothetical protein BASA81_007073 [Batrachochytrium salamandrivorans]|nr:hypothetical protein BASA81_007073 [Batrachochytrium salamandrivorans]